MSHDPDDVLDFWVDAGPQRWWSKDDAFDLEIRNRFASTYELACAGDLDHRWIEPDAALALIIVLDQFSRNLFRDDGRAFAHDEKCLSIVHGVIASGRDRKMRQDIGMFCYLPLMHSEKLEDQRLCLAEMQRLGLAPQIEFAQLHLDVIARFGRFPHRNAALGRQSTEAEREFLDQGGFAG